MTLTNIQHTAGICCALVGNKAAPVTTQTGHTIEAFGSHALNAGKSLCGGVHSAALKCAAFAKAFLSSACMYTNMGWQVAKYAGARGWEMTKVGGSILREKASFVFSKAVSGGSSLMGTLGNVASATYSTLKSLAIKITLYAAATISRFASFAKGVFIATGASIVHGAQLARNFVLAHPKELCLVGGGIGIGIAIGIATAVAAQVLYPPAAEIA